MIKKNDVSSNCWRCGQSTLQSVLLETSDLGTKEIFFEKMKGEPLYIIEQAKWRLSKCCGCDSVNVRVDKFHVGESLNILRKLESVDFPSTREYQIPKWIFALKPSYIELLREIYHALQGGAYRLVLLGARALIDDFMLEHVGDIGSFKQKVDKLLEIGLINKTQKNLLESLLDAGNAANHRRYSPDEQTTLKIIQIFEHLLKEQVLIPIPDFVKEKVPPKKSKTC